MGIIVSQGDWLASAKPLVTWAKSWALWWLEQGPGAISSQGVLRQVVY